MGPQMKAVCSVAIVAILRDRYITRQIAPTGVIVNYRA
jgi:hypothetical protein